MPVLSQLHQLHLAGFRSVVKQALEFFADTPIHHLPIDEPFQGVGVYAIYLLKHADIYRDIADPTFTRPIYVGKAVPSGWRTARLNTFSRSSALFSRLNQHANSISQTNNLNVKDFRSRFMILNNDESDLIVPVEAALIRNYKPLWNSVIDGFGNHDPGSGRTNSAFSAWDTLHPGREWAKRLTGKQKDLPLILTNIKKYVDELRNSP